MCGEDRHCCGVGAKKSVVFSAFYSVFTAVVCMSMMLLRFTTKVDLEIHADVSALSYGSLAIYSIHIVASFVLLAGANLDRRGTFFPWVAWTAVVMMYEALAVLLYFTASKHKQKGLRRWDIFSSFFYVIRTSVNIYCLICVICRHQLIRASEETPCTYIFPSPDHCGRRDRHPKDLITVVESAFRPSSQSLDIAPNTVFLMTSLPPPYEATEPPPYGGDAECQQRRLPNPRDVTRVVVECVVAAGRGCDGYRPADQSAAGQLTLLRQKHTCDCTGRATAGAVRAQTRLRHGTILWDVESDEGEGDGEAEGEGEDVRLACPPGGQNAGRRLAIVYRNPMVASGTSCSPAENEEE